MKLDSVFPVRGRVTRLVLQVSEIPGVPLVKRGLHGCAAAVGRHAKFATSSSRVNHCASLFIPIRTAAAQQRLRQVYRRGARASGCVRTKKLQFNPQRPRPRPRIAENTRRTCLTPISPEIPTRRFSSSSKESKRRRCFGHRPDTRTRADPVSTPHEVFFRSLRVQALPRLTRAPRVSFIALPEL